MTGMMPYPTPPNSASPPGRSSTDTQRTGSEASIPLPSGHAHTQSTHSQHRYSQSHTTRYTEEQPHNDATSELDTADPLDPEVRLRKRDYAVEISRIMGRQLVAAMNSGKRKSSTTSTDERYGSDDRREGSVL